MKAYTAFLVVGSSLVIIIWGFVLARDGISTFDVNPGLRSRIESKNDIYSY